MASKRKKKKLILKITKQKQTNKQKFNDRLKYFL